MKPKRENNRELEEGRVAYVFCDELSLQNRRAQSSSPPFTAGVVVGVFLPRKAGSLSLTSLR